MTSTPSSLLVNSDASALRAVWRAADAARRLEPVVVRAAGALWLVVPLERLGAAVMASFREAADDPFRLLITGNRAEVMHIGSKGWPVVPLDWPPYVRFDELHALVDPTLDLQVPVKGPFRRTDTPPGDAEMAAIKLMKLARLLPGAVIAPVGAETAEMWLSTDADAILGAEASDAQQLAEVARARVPLAGAENTQIISFRSKTGGSEHLAILIGDPDLSAAVLARVHSECFTGDLIGSLKCDCGDQLKGAIKAIADAGGGLVLYLAQEGRGIGLISKLKAYSLQDQGFDTVDANTRLGFEVDERLFQPAATMLRALGVDAVRLMTNNPNKVEALERYGITVAERVPHLFPTNDHNRSYLATKARRTGHVIDTDEDLRPETEPEARD